MSFHRRDSHVMEVQSGTHTKRQEDACTTLHFNRTNLPYVTLVSKYAVRLSHTFHLHLRVRPDATRATLWGNGKGLKTSAVTVIRIRETIYEKGRAGRNLSLQGTRCTLSLLGCRVLGSSATPFQSHLISISLIHFFTSSPNEKKINYSIWNLLPLR